MALAVSKSSKGMASGLPRTSLSRSRCITRLSSRRLASVCSLQSRSAFRHTSLSFSMSVSLHKLQLVKDHCLPTLAGAMAQNILFLEPLSTCVMSIASQHTGTGTRSRAETLRVHRCGSAVKQQASLERRHVEFFT